MEYRAAIRSLEALVNQLKAGLRDYEASEANVREYYHRLGEPPPPSDPLPQVFSRADGYDEPEELRDPVYEVELESVFIEGPGRAVLYERSGTTAIVISLRRR